MPANFTEKEREKIRRDLIDAGFQMSRECGLKGMTVSKPLFEESDRQQMQEFAALLRGRDRLPIEEMMPWYRSLFAFERNFIMSFKTEDFIWLKEHLRSFGMFDAERDKAGARRLLEMVDGIRMDYDCRLAHCHNVFTILTGIHAVDAVY